MIASIPTFKFVSAFEVLPSEKTKILSLLISLTDKINDQISQASMRGRRGAKRFQMFPPLVYQKRKTLAHKTLTCCDLGENDELANSL